MEIIGDEELKISEEITPKEYWADHKDCKDAKEISQQNQITDSTNK